MQLLRKLVITNNFFKNDQNANMYPNVMKKNCNEYTIYLK